MTYEDFSKLELRIAKVLLAERVAGSDKLIKMRVRLGDPLLGSGLADRQIVAGIGKVYSPEELVGREIVVVANLDPRVMMGEESNGMLLAAHDSENQPVILIPEKEVPPGAAVS